MRQPAIALKSPDAETPAAPPADTSALLNAEKDSALPPLTGRFMLSDGREFPCAVSDPGSTSAMFHCDESVQSGERLVAYVEGLGRIEGVAGELVDGGFRVHMAFTAARRARLEQNLRWLRLKQHGLASEERHGTRFAPSAGTARVTLGGGEEHACEVLDISLSGAAIRCGVRPEPGSCVWLGKTRGRVIRHLADGFAIEFMAPLDQAGLYHGLR